MARLVAHHKRRPVGNLLCRGDAGYGTAGHPLHLFYRARQRDSRAGRRRRVSKRDGAARPGDWVGIYSWNRVEWVEAMIACYKARAVPINVNYRYVEAELTYLFDNADLRGLIFERGFSPIVAAIATGSTI